MPRAAILLSKYLRAEIDNVAHEGEQILFSMIPALQLEALRISSRQLGQLHTLQASYFASWNAAAAALLSDLQTTAVSASTLTKKVRVLDRYQTLINFAIGVLQQLIDLVQYAKEVEYSIEVLRDYETAAKTISKYRVIIGNDRVNNQKGASKTATSEKTESLLTLIPTGEHSRHSINCTAAQALLSALGLRSVFQRVASSLQQNEVKVTSIVRRQFEQSIAQKDREGVSRNAKLLYPLGIQKEGISRFIQFIRVYINDQCAANIKKLTSSRAGRASDSVSASGLHAEVLTSVFVSVADIIQQHQQNIEQEFGPENFILFCRGLQEEADVQGIRVLDHYYNSNNLGKCTSQCTEEPSRDLKHLDAMLDEVTVLSQRCQQFDVYLRRCSSAVLKTVTTPSEIVAGNHADSVYNRTDGLLTLSALAKRIQEIMGVYVTLELSFMQLSLQIALRDSDEVTWDDADVLTSTCVEDAFFILHKSVARAISGSDVYAACAVVNHVINLLSTEVKGVLEENLQESKPFYAEYIQQSSERLTRFKPREAIPDSVLKDLDDNRPLGASYSWTHSVNNVQVCCEYLDRFQCRCEALFDDRFASAGEPDADMPENDRIDSGRMMFHHTFQNLEGVKSDFSSLHSYECKVTLNILKCHLFDSLQPLDAISYDISQAQYDDYQVNDPFIRNFVDSLRLLHSHLQSSYSAASVSLCVQLLVEKVCRRLESAFRSKSSFSVLGGVQVDADIRFLMSFCTEISSQSLRSKFGRLIELGDLVSLGSLDELADIWGPASNKTWRLSVDDMKQILGLRSDFSKNVIAGYFVNPEDYGNY